MDLSSLGRALADTARNLGMAALRGAADGARRSATPSGRNTRRINGTRSSNRRRPRPSPKHPAPAGPDGLRCGPDYVGRPPTSYSPSPNGVADPGEIVWAWVPFEEDHSQGKDRPTLIIGRDGSWLLALPVTSKDHDRDEAQEARAGRYWLDLGAGAWDRNGRESEVRLDRIVRLAPQAVRREGATLPRTLFEEVLVEVNRHAS